MKLASLYKVNEAGHLLAWRIWTDDNVVHVRHGRLDGKIQEDTYSVLEGTNIGKSNERDIFEQAEFEAEAKWKKQVTYNGYFESKEEAYAALTNEWKTKGDGGPVPMKAQRWSEQKHKMPFPCYVQPKLDGIRCIAVCSLIEGEPRVNLYTNSGKIILGFTDVTQELLGIMSIGDILDGELYKHGMPLQEISGIVRQTKDYSKKHLLEYWVFDRLNGSPFSTRLSRYNFNEPCNRRVYFTATFVADNEKEAEKLYETWVEEGFEGMMYRNPEGLYEQKRSYNILKRKDFMDDEFKIVGYTMGTKDSTKDLIVSFDCVTKEGKHFDAPMCGSDSYRRLLAEDHSLWKGKYLTVRFLNYSSYGVPVIPKGGKNAKGKMCLNFIVREGVGED